MSVTPKPIKGKMLFDAHQFLTKAVEAYTYDLDSVKGNPDYNCYHAEARERWLKGFRKKYLLPGDRATRADKALAKFASVNQEMREYYNFTHTRAKEENQVIIQCAKHWIYHLLGPAPSWEEIYVECKNSNGTSIGVPFWDTSPERKFRYPISMTASCKPLWEDYLAWDKDLDQAIQLLNETFENVSSKVGVVEGSRAATVPKTDDIDRMIAVEPVANMWFQHGVSRFMERRLARAGLSFDRDPEKHRRWACWGSITNRLATIDFSSMSDRVSIGVAKYLLPEDWYVLLDRVRSPEMSVKGVSTDLYMISTMGNATTFPLETLILFAIAVSVKQSYISRYRVVADLRHGFVNSPWFQNISVFGDDCILEQQYVPTFLSVCEDLGFQPNLDKSFWREEYFRESCGGDFFHGRDVRPLFLGALPETRSKVAWEAYLYSTINGVIRKYISYFGVLEYIYGRHLLQYLFECLSLVTDKVKFVPEDFPEDSGITSISDIKRFTRAYDIRCSDISVSEHGSLFFSYLRFVYSERSEIDDRLRYALELKRLWRDNGNDTDRHRYIMVFGKENIVRERNLRKRGKYVVSKCKGDYSLRQPSTLKARVSSYLVKRR